MSTTASPHPVLRRCCICRKTVFFHTTVRKPACPSCDHVKSLYCAGCNNYVSVPFAFGAAPYRSIIIYRSSDDKIVVFCPWCYPPVDPAGPGGGTLLRPCGCVLVSPQSRAWDCWVCGTDNFTNDPNDTDPDMCVRCGYIRDNNGDCGRNDGRGDGCVEIAFWFVNSQREFDSVVGDMSLRLAKKLEAWDMDACRLRIRSEGTGRRSFMEAKRDEFRREAGR